MVNIFLADGFEDVEALGTYDVLVRGGVETYLVSTTGSLIVKSSHGVEFTAHRLFEPEKFESEVEDFMVFPGGMPGSKNLADNQELISKMRAHYEKGGGLGAICAAPALVLSQLGEEVWNEAEFTCFDGFEQHLLCLGAKFTAAPSSVAGRIVTGRSAGHCFSFGLAILNAIKGAECAEKVAKSLFLD